MFSRRAFSAMLAGSVAAMRGSFAQAATQRMAFYLLERDRDGGRALAEAHARLEVDEQRLPRREAGAERAPERPWAPVLHVGRAGHGEEGDAEKEDEADDLLGTVRVLRRVTHVRVAQGGDRHGDPGARGLVLRIAHERSPIQKQTRTRPPTPISRATKLRRPNSACA